MQMNRWLAVGFALMIAVAGPAFATKDAAVPGKGLTETGPGLFVPPANDNLASAIVVGGMPYTNAQSTVDATMEAGEPAGCGALGSSVWYTVTPAASTVLTVTTIGSNYDTVLDARTGPGFGASVACNDDSIGLLSSIQFAVNAGQTYNIRAGGFAGSQGSLVINIDACGSPANDNQANAASLGSATINTACATTEVGEATPDCSFGGAPVGKTVWFAFNGVGAPMTITTQGSTFDTIIAVYAVGPVTGTQYGEGGDILGPGFTYPGIGAGTTPCNDDDTVAANLQSTVTFVPVPGIQYYVQVGSWGNGPGGNLVLTVT